MYGLVMEEVIYELPGIDGGIIQTALTDTIIDLSRVLRVEPPERTGVCHISKEMYDRHLPLIKAGVFSKVYKSPTVMLSVPEAPTLASLYAAEYITALNKIY